MRERGKLLVAALALMALGPLDAWPLGRNLGFELWDASGRPAGWHLGSTPGYRASRDCAQVREGRCTLRLESLPGAAKAFLPLSQQVPLPGVGGHRLRLSGMIRTENVRDGWAGLWMRVDGGSRSVLQFDNLYQGGPRGTTEWRRFEVALPVAPNARAVTWGVLLSGFGAAWFDDLALEVDRSVTVEPAEVPEPPPVPSPPRPVPHAGLLDDAALALPQDERPGAPAEWAADVRRRHHAIRSLFSDDFSDLRFLEPLLAGKRVVQLGESGHGVAEFNWLKVRLIKYLHQALGYDVVAFESSLSGCAIADARVETDAPLQVMRDCLFAVWHTAETLGFFEYLESARRAGRRLTLAGFDVQNSGAASSEIRRRTVALAEVFDARLARALDGYEARLARMVLGDEAEQMVRAYRTLAGHLDREPERAARAARLTPEQVALAAQECRARIRYIEMHTYAMGVPEVTQVRDQGMADNLDFVLDRLFPGRKVIVWAHNFHIAKRAEGHAQPRAMGAWVDQRRGSEVYTIGLYMGRGAAAANTRERYAIAPPPEASLEAVLAQAGRRMSFVDFSRAEPAPDSWMLQAMVARSWGVNALRIVPARTYDGVIYIDTVTPPEYR